MMIKFKLNRKLEVYAQDNLKIGASTVQDEGKESIYISYPMGPGGAFTLTPGDTIKVTYCGEGNKFYEFVTEVDEIVTDDRIPLVKIYKPSDYEVIKKRKYVRVPIILDVQFLVVDDIKDIPNLKPEKLKKIYRPQQWVNGYAYDISAGGLGAVIQEPIGYNKRLVCIIKDSYFDRAYIGKIVRASEKRQGERKLYSIGVEFLNLDYPSEEKLVRYIFQKMREQLKFRQSESE